MADGVQPPALHLTRRRKACHVHQDHRHLRQPARSSRVRARLRQGPGRPRPESPGSAAGRVRQGLAEGGRQPHAGLPSPGSVLRGLRRGERGGVIARGGRSLPECLRAGDRRRPDRLRQPRGIMSGSSSGRVASVDPDRDEWDVVVVGGGAAGENAAQYASQFSGLSTVIIENELLGGECSYWACMPSKGMLRPVELLSAARALPGVRELVGDRPLDAAAVLGRRDVIVKNHDDGSQVAWAVGAGIAGSVLIMGGGVVACEAATWLAALGAEVTVVEMSDRLLGRNEPFVGALLGERFAGTGVTVHLSTTVASVERAEVNAAGTGRLHGGPLTVTLASGETLRVDELVVAVGRRANSDGLGLEEVGLPGTGFVGVDDQFEVLGVAGRWLYAVGDVCGRSLLTHMGKYQARIAGEVIAARAQGVPLETVPYNRHTDLADHGLVPQVTFTDPEIGSVGLTEQQARDTGLDA